MISKLIDGKHLHDEELAGKLNDIYEKEPFKKLVTTMQAVKDFDVRKLKPKKAYAFDVATGDEKKLNYFSSSIIHLVDDNETVSILYNELANVEDHAVGQILENGSNTLQLYIYDEGEVKISESQTELVSLAYEDNANEDLPDNPDYQAGNFTSDIEAQVWWTGDGCLPGGYQHCGANCGYNMDHGGGKPINSTDTCCVAHDNCWKVYGKWDSCCDKRLRNCVLLHTTVAAASIRDFFGPSALRCLFG